MRVQIPPVAQGFRVVWSLRIGRFAFDFKVRA